MAEKMKEMFNPVYNSIEQVKDCAGYPMRDVVIDAKIAFVIGHNGMSFVSSTDWRLTTASGRKRIFPFSIRPQYPNFLECVAGVSYTGQQGQFTVLPDKEPRAAVVELDGQKYLFAPGEALKIYVEPNSRFVATDCLVTCEDGDGQGPRVYQVITDEDTLYGKLDDKGRVSQV